MEVVWISDLHFGLKTDGISRNEEIYDVTLQAIKFACKLKKASKDVIMVIGGDIFNTNNPSEDQIQLFIKLLAYLHKYEVNTYILDGNHEAIFDRERKSCLSFISTLEHLSENIKRISDISFMTYKSTDLGPIAFSFLPHITKAHYVEGTYKNTQDYIEQKCRGILEKLGNQYRHYAFSHLNVKGVHPGSEENLLKKSEVYLPSCYVDKTTMVDNRPTIIQGHIHTPFIQDNINGIGSPIFCSFGEDVRIPKQFLHLHIPETFGDKEEWNYIETNCTIFNQVELDLTDVDWRTTDFFDIPEVKEMLNFKEGRKYHLKFDVTVNATECNINWDKIKQHIEDKYTLVKVKPIVPKFVRTKITRSSEQKLGLNPVDAVKVFLKTNKPKNAKAKYALAKKYIGVI